MTRRSRQYAGFTFLELLVAMSLMVVAGSCLYTSLYTGFQSERTAKFAIEPTAQAINAIELIKQDIYGILPATGVMAGSFVGTDDTGMRAVDTDSLEFYTTHITANGDDQPVGGIAKINLLLEEETDDDLSERYEIEHYDDLTNYRLVREVTTNLLSSRSLDPEQQVLCRNVVSLNLRYFDGDDWLDDWDSTEDANNLPLALEIEIRVAYKYRQDATTTERRRLIQSFPLPCGGEAPEEDSEETEEESGDEEGSQDEGASGQEEGGGELLMGGGG
jgi:type II secretory pathway component PulJ